jgi:hypothetical protein
VRFWALGHRELYASRFIQAGAELCGVSLGGPIERRPALASQDVAPSGAIFPRGGVVFAVDFTFEKAKPALWCF